MSRPLQLNQTLYGNCGGVNGASGCIIGLGHLGPSNFLAHLNGSRLVILDNSLTELQTFHFPEDDPPTCVDSSRVDGKIAVGFKNSIRIFKAQLNENVLSWSELTVITGMHGLTAITWDWKGLKLLSAGTHVLLWAPKDLAEGNVDLEGLYTDQKQLYVPIWQYTLPSSVAYMKFSPDGRLFYTLSRNDRLLKVWYPRAVEFSAFFPEKIQYDFKYLPHPRAVTNVSWRVSPNLNASDHPFIQNVLLTSCLDNVVRIWTETTPHEPVNFFVSGVITLPPASRPLFKTPFVAHWVQYEACYRASVDPETPSSLKDSMKGLHDNTTATIEQRPYLQNLSTHREHRKQNDLVFSVHPDGSWIFWLVDFMEDTPRRVSQITLVSILADVVPLYDAVSPVFETFLFPERDESSRLPPNGDPRRTFQYLTPPMLNVGVILMHESGVLTRWSVGFNELPPYATVTKLTISSRNGGHRFSVRSCHCHPRLPYIVTVGHNDRGQSEILLWKHNSDSWMASCSEDRDSFKYLSRISFEECKEAPLVAWFPSISTTSFAVLAGNKLSVYSFGVSLNESEFVGISVLRELAVIHEWPKGDCVSYNALLPLSSHSDAESDQFWLLGIPSKGQKVSVFQVTIYTMFDSEHHPTKFHVRRDSTSKLVKDQISHIQKLRSSLPQRQARASVDEERHSANASPILRRRTALSRTNSAARSKRGSDSDASDLVRTNSSNQLNRVASLERVASFDRVLSEASSDNERAFDSSMEDLNASTEFNETFFDEPLDFWDSDSRNEYFEQFLKRPNADWLKYFPRIDCKCLGDVLLTVSSDQTLLSPTEKTPSTATVPELSSLPSTVTFTSAALVNGSSPTTFPVVIDLISSMALLVIGCSDGIIRTWLCHGEETQERLSASSTPLTETSELPILFSHLPFLTTSQALQSSSGSHDSCLTILDCTPQGRIAVLSCPGVSGENLGRKNPDLACGSVLSILELETTVSSWHAEFEVRFENEFILSAQFIFNSVSGSMLGLCTSKRVQIFSQGSSGCWDIISDTPLLMSPSAFCFCSTGVVIVGSDVKLAVYQKWLVAGGKGVNVEIYESHMPKVVEEESFPLSNLFWESARHAPRLPQYHPMFLLQLLMSGKMVVVETILKGLWNTLYQENLEPEALQKAVLERIKHPFHPISVAEIVATTNEANSTNQGPADKQEKFSALFASPSEGQDSSTTHSLSSMCSHLGEILMYAKLPGLSSIEQLRLLAIVETIGKLETKSSSLDECGVRFLLAVRLYTCFSRSLPSARRPSGLSSSEIIWAFHSESQDRLLDSCQAFLGTENLDWATLRSIGFGYWVKAPDTVKKYLEIVAKNAFQQTKNPLDGALFYLILRKKTVLLQLFKNVNDSRMITFFGNDFTTEKWQVAAVKNAFALLGKQRFEEAVAFFLLGDKVSDAVGICMRNLNDPQLALVILRIYDNNASLPELAASQIIPWAEQNGDVWVLSIIRWILKDLIGSVQVLLTSKTVRDPPPPLTFDMTSSSSSSSSSTSSAGAFRDDSEDWSSALLVPGLLGLYQYLYSHPLIKTARATLHVSDMSPAPENLYLWAIHKYSQMGIPYLALTTLTAYQQQQELYQNELLEELKRLTSSNPNDGSSQVVSAPVASGPTPEQLLAEQKKKADMINSGTFSFDAFDEWGDDDADSSAPNPTPVVAESNANSEEQAKLAAESVARTTQLKHSVNKLQLKHTMSTILFSGVRLNLCLFLMIGSLEFDQSIFANDFIKYIKNELKTLLTVSSLPNFNYRNLIELLFSYSHAHELNPLKCKVLSLFREPPLAMICSLARSILNVITTLSPKVRSVSYSAMYHMKSEAKELSRCFMFLVANWDRFHAPNLTLTDLQEVKWAVYLGLLVPSFFCGELDTVLRLLSHLPNSKEMCRAVFPGCSSLSDVLTRLKYKNMHFPMVPVQPPPSASSSPPPLSVSSAGLAEYFLAPINLDEYRIVDDSADSGSTPTDGTNLTGSELSDYKFRWTLLRLLMAEYLVLNIRHGTGSQSGGKHSVNDLQPLNSVCFYLEQNISYFESELHQSPVPEAFRQQSPNAGDYPSRSIFKILSLLDPSSNPFIPIDARRIWHFLLKKQFLQGTVEHFVYRKSPSTNHAMPSTPRASTSQLPPMQNPGNNNTSVGGFSNNGTGANNSISVSLANSTNGSGGPDSPNNLTISSRRVDTGEWYFLHRVPNSEITSIGYHHSKPNLLVIAHSRGVTELHLSLSDEDNVVHDSNRRAALSLDSLSGGGSLSYSPVTINSEVSLCRVGVQRPLSHCSRLCVHPSAKYYLAGQYDSTLSFWEFELQENIATIPNGGGGSKITRIQFDPFGSKFGVTSESGELSLWKFGENSSSSRPFLRFQCHNRRADALSFLSSSSFLATGGASTDLQCVRLWDTLLPPRSSNIKSFAVNDGGTKSMLYIPDIQQLVCGSRKGELTLIDIRQRQVVHTWQAHDQSIKAIQLYEPGGQFVTCSSDGSVKAWSLQTFSEMALYSNIHARGTLSHIFRAGVLDLSIAGNRFYTCGADGVVNMYVN